MVGVRVLRGDGDSFGMHEGLAVPLEHTYCQRVLDGRLPNLMPDVRGDERSASLTATDAADVGAFATVPITLSDGQLYGTLCAASHAAQPALEFRDLQFLHVFARIVADQIERARQQKHTQALQLRASATSTLLAALGARDGYTGEHSEAVLELAIRVADRLGLDDSAMDQLRQVTLLHDIGKLLIAQLYEAARSDPLTNLPNRRAFRELLDHELARARRGEISVTVVAGDLDHFKEVNDRSGHQVGDAALQRVARLFEREKREIDGVARVGGEEFALVFPDTDGHGAFVIAERLRCELQDEFSDDAVPVTVSFGVASFPQQGETAASLLQAADEALYAAKTSGRNRTVIHSTVLRGASPDDRDSRDVPAERFVAVILDLAEAVDLRFSGSARHSETVGRYAEMMARELGLSEQRIGRVRLAGLLHDIGKVGVPDSILRKPAKLTADELNLIRKHPELGAQILEHPSLADIREWVGAHHERPDGHGYPRGLRDDAIPLEARILAVADAYEAMTSDRAYRSSMGQPVAREELERGAGTQFDPRVVAALLTVLERETEQANTVLWTSPGRLRR